MGSMVDITLENFEATAIQGSMQRAVVMLFWSARGPAGTQLNTSLERLSKEMDFTLAKVEVEPNEQIASYFRLTEVPSIRIILKGQIAASIPGNATETQIRTGLAKYFLSEDDLALIEAEHLVQQGIPEQAMPILDVLLTTKPANKKALYCKAKALVDLNKTEDALQILVQFSEGDDFFREAKALKELMAFHQECSRKDLQTPSELAYRDACALALAGQYREALEGFLALFAQEKTWREDAARKAMLTLFGVLGPKHELTWEYRSRLNSLLFI